MHLLNAFSLLWTLPVLGGIILLWKLKLNRKPLTVPSLRLWQGLYDDKQANTPFNKLRRSLLLFIQLLAAFLLIFALSSPYVPGLAPAPRTIVFVVNTSASMNATDVGPSRFEAARAACRRDIAGQLREFDSGALLCVGRDVILTVPFTNRKQLLLDGLNRLAPTDESPDIAGGIALAGSILTGHSDPQVRVYSDGVYSDDEARKLARVDITPAVITNIKIGSQNARNAGITGVEARINPETGATELDVEISQCGGAITKNSTVTLSVDGTVIAVRSLQESMTTDDEQFNSALINQGKIAKVTLDSVNDDLSDDNAVTVPLPKSLPEKVLLVSSGNLFLERGLSVDKTIQVSEVSPADYLTHKSDLTGYAVTVFDSYLPSGHVGPGRYITINAEGTQFPIGFTNDIINDPQWIDQDLQSPVMRYVSMDGTLIARAPRTILAPWGTSLAESDGGTLIAASDHDRIRCVDVAWNLSDSNWPLRVSFPIFLNNAVRWLTANRGENGSALNLRAGDSVEFDMPFGSSNLQIARPDGRIAVLPVPADGGSVAYLDTDIVGHYAASATTFHADAYVNLLNSTASQITPHDLPTIRDGSGSSVVYRPVRVHRELAAWIAVAGLILIVIEWIIYHRRT